jgi:hypothetical protein
VARLLVRLTLKLGIRAFPEIKVNVGRHLTIAGEMTKK